MIVCSCNVVSDTTIRSVLDASSGRVCPRTPSAVYKCLGCSPNCGRCFKTIRDIIDETPSTHPHSHGHAQGHAHGQHPCDASTSAPAGVFAAKLAAV